MGNDGTTFILPGNTAVRKGKEAMNKQILLHLLGGSGEGEK
jgi:hypothetical protein